MWPLCRKGETLVKIWYLWYFCTRRRERCCRYSCKFFCKIRWWPKLRWLNGGYFAIYCKGYGRNCGGLGSRSACEAFCCYIRPYSLIEWRGWGGSWLILRFGLGYCWTGMRSFSWRFWWGHLTNCHILSM